MNKAWRVSSSGIWRCVVCWVVPDVACSLLCWTILRSWRWRLYVPPKRQVPLNALHGVISQKKLLFKTTAVKTSNPTNKAWFVCPVSDAKCVCRNDHTPILDLAAPLPFHSVLFLFQSSCCFVMASMESCYVPCCDYVIICYSLWLF
jgi:hypothetical protein